MTVESCYLRNLTLIFYMFVKNITNEKLLLHGRCRTYVEWFFYWLKRTRPDCLRNFYYVQSVYISTRKIVYYLFIYN